MKKATALPIFSLLMVWLATLDAAATIVSFGFSGTVSSLQNPSNALPAEIAEGAPFSGILTYDTTAMTGGGDSDPSPTTAAYYYNSNGGLWLSLGITGHTFDSAKPAPGDPFADILIYNFPNPQDVFWVDASAPTIRFDGGPLPGNAPTKGFTFLLADNTGTAYPNDSLPLVPPNLSAFTNSHYVSVYAYGPQGTTFYLTGDVTGISAPHPILNIRPLPNQTVLLSWPTAARGFQLLQNTNLATGIGWQTNAAPIIDTETAHTVTVPLASSTFYRLKSP